MTATIAVLGIGNVLMGDDGFGVHAVRTLTAGADLPDGVRVIDGGTAGMELLPDLDGLDHLIVVDAVKAGQPAGSVIRLVDDEVPAFFKTKLSPHQMGLSDILAALLLLGTPPRRVVLIGVEPGSLAAGTELTAPVAARLAEVAAMVRRELAAIEAAPLKYATEKRLPSGLTLGSD